jgi:hypothetical protein
VELVMIYEVQNEKIPERGSSPVQPSLMVAKIA